MLRERAFTAILTASMILTGFLSAAHGQTCPANATTWRATAIADVLVGGPANRAANLRDIKKCETDDGITPSPALKNKIACLSNLKRLLEYRTGGVVATLNMKDPAYRAQIAYPADLKNPTLLRAIKSAGFADLPSIEAIRTVVAHMNAQEARTVPGVTGWKLNPFRSADLWTTGGAHGFITGFGPVRLAGTAAPGGFSLATDYWVSKVDDLNFKLASSYANAVAGTVISRTSAGTGPFSVILPVLPSVSRDWMMAVFAGHVAGISGVNAPTVGNEARVILYSPTQGVWANFVISATAPSKVTTALNVSLMKVVKGAMYFQDWGWNSEASVPSSSTPPSTNGLAGISPAGAANDGSCSSCHISGYVPIKAKRNEPKIQGYSATLSANRPTVVEQREIDALNAKSDAYAGVAHDTVARVLGDVAFGTEPFQCTKASVNVPAATALTNAPGGACGNCHNGRVRGKIYDAWGAEHMQAYFTGEPLASSAATLTHSLMPPGNTLSKADRDSLSACLLRNRNDRLGAYLAEVDCGTGRGPPVAASVAIDTIKSTHINRGKKTRLLQDSLNVRNGKAGKDTRFVIVGGGPTGGMAALSAIAAGANPAKIWVVEQRTDYTRKIIISAPQDPLLPVDWATTSPFYRMEGRSTPYNALSGTRFWGQRLLHFENSYRAALEDLGVTFVTGTAVKVCGAAKQVVLLDKAEAEKPTRDTGDARLDKFDLCRQLATSAVRPPIDPGGPLPSAAGVKVTGALLNGGAALSPAEAPQDLNGFRGIPYDVLVLVAGRASHKLFGAANIKNIWTDAVPLPLSTPLPVMKSAAWVYEATNTVGGATRCFPSVIEPAGPGAMDLLPHPRVVSTLSDACYLVVDREPGTPAPSPVSNTYFQAVARAFWPLDYPGVTAAVTGAPSGEFKDEVYAASPTSLYDQGTGSLVICEGDCAGSPLHETGANIDWASEGLAKLAPVFKKIIEEGIAHRDVNAAWVTAEAARANIRKGLAYNHCNLIGSRLKPRLAKQVDDACAAAIRREYRSAWTPGASYPEVPAPAALPPSPSDPQRLAFGAQSAGHVEVIATCLACHTPIPTDGMKNMLRQRADWDVWVNNMNRGYMSGMLSENSIKAIVTYLKAVNARLPP